MLGHLQPQWWPYLDPIYIGPVSALTRYVCYTVMTPVWLCSEKDPWSNTVIHEVSWWQNNQIPFLITGFQWIKCTGIEVLIPRTKLKCFLCFVPAKWNVDLILIMMEKSANQILLTKGVDWLVKFNARLLVWCDCWAVVKSSVCVCVCVCVCACVCECCHSAGVASPVLEPISHNNYELIIQILQKFILL